MPENHTVYIKLKIPMEEMDGTPEESVDIAVENLMEVVPEIKNGWIVIIGAEVENDGIYKEIIMH
jgi:hypothetical protein